MQVDLLGIVFVSGALRAGHQETDPVLVVDEEAEDEVIEPVRVEVLSFFFQHLLFKVIEHGIHFLKGRANQSVEQRFLVRKGEVERTCRDARRGADLPKRSFLVAVLQKMSLGRRHQIVDDTPVEFGFLRHITPLTVPVIWFFYMWDYSTYCHANATDTYLLLFPAQEEENAQSACRHGHDQRPQHRLRLVSGIDRRAASGRRPCGGRRGSDDSRRRPDGRRSRLGRSRQLCGIL